VHGPAAYLDSRDETHARVLEPKQLLGLPWRAALALQREGWWLRDAIV
jgi:hypothetical protein